MSTAHPVDLSGLWVPIVTPFSADGSLDVGSLERLAARLLADGATGLVALGTTGEPATLDTSERASVVNVCDQACRDAGKRLMIGTGTNSTTGTIAETAFLTDGVEATAVLIVVPYYTRPSEQAVVDHMHLVADASPVPVVIYNVPYRTGLGLSSAAVLDAASHSNVAGLKQSVGKLDIETLEIINNSRDDVAVLAGDDAFITPSILMGGHGAISAAAHFCTSIFAEMVDAALAHDSVRAAHLAAQLLPVITTGFAEPSPSVWKAALAAQGMIESPTVRRPLTPATDVATQRLVDASSRAHRSRRHVRND